MIVLSPSTGVGAVVVHSPLTKYSTVAPSSVPATVKSPLLVRKSSAKLPLSVSSEICGTSGAVVSRVNVSVLLSDEFPASSVWRIIMVFSPSTATGSVVVHSPSTKYSTVAPSSISVTVYEPSFVKKSSALEPLSVSSVIVGADGAMESMSCNAVLASFSRSNRERLCASFKPSACNP